MEFFCWQNGFLFFVGVILFSASALAATQTLTVQSCSSISGTVTISNCSGLNTSDNSADVTIAKNAVLGTTMSDTSFSGTITSVTITFRHSGQSGIGGSAGIQFYDSANNTGFCTQDTTVPNGSSYATHSRTACTPSGGWTTTKLDNLQMRFRNNDPGSPQNETISYALVTIAYTAPAVCGDGSLDLTEGCDQGGGNIANGDGCSSVCQIESGWNCAGIPSTCSPVCGNGTIHGSEVCDGNSLNGQTCVSQGFTGGTLACNGSCSAYNTSACTSFSCGNNILEGTEVCDGSDLNSQTCVSQGFLGGTLSCNGSCTAFNTASCTSAVCGNNVQEGSEICDGSDLDSQTCISRGFDSGTLGCESDCGSFDTASCVTNEVCGNGTIAGPEVCDGNNLNSQTCETQGFESGSLSCSGNCLNFDTSACVSPVAPVPLCGEGCCGGGTCDADVGEDYFTCTADCRTPGKMTIQLVSPALKEEYLSGDTVLVQASVTADSKSRATVDLFTVEGSFGVLALVDDGTQGDLVAGDRVYSNEFVVDDLNTSRSGPLVLSATIAQTTQILNATYQVVPVLALNVVPNKKTYSLGDVVRLIGLVKRSKNPVIQDVHLVLSSGEHVLLDQVVKSSSDGSFSAKYQTTSLDPEGNWTIKADAMDSAGNYGFLVSSIKVFKPQAFVSLSIQVLSDTTHFWVRGQTQSVLIRVLDQYDESVEGAKVSWTDPLGKSIDFSETDDLAYRLDYPVPIDLPLGSQSFRVHAEAKTPQSTEQGNETLQWNVSAAPLTIAIVEPNRFVGQSGDGIYVVVRVTYANGKPAELQNVEGLINGQSVRFTEVEPGLYKAEYVVTLADQGRSTFSIVVSDAFGNNGQTEIPLAISGISPLYYVRQAFWPLVFLGIGIIAVFGLFFQSQIIRLGIQNKESQLKKVEAKLADNQNRFFKLNSISRETYNKMQASYSMEREKLLTEIQKLKEKQAGKK